MAADDRVGIADVVNRTEQLYAALMTAKASDDPQVIHASIIEAVEGLLTCVRSIASELIKVEIEGIDEGVAGS